MMRSTPAARQIVRLALEQGAGLRASGHSCCFEVRSLPATTGRMVDMEPATATCVPCRRLLGDRHRGTVDFEQLVVAVQRIEEQGAGGKGIGDDDVRAGPDVIAHAPRARHRDG